MNEINVGKVINNQINFRNLVIKILLSNINKDIDNVDESVQFVMEMINEESQKKQIVSNKKQQLIEIKEQLEIFVNQVKKIPQIWMSMIIDNKLQKIQNKIILNQTIVITLVFEQLMKNVNIKIIQKRKLINGEQSKHKQKQIIIKDFDFRKMYFDESSMELMGVVLNYYADKIVVCFEWGKAFIIEQAEVIQKLIKNLKIMNTYILFALIKQMSRSTYTKIKQIYQQYLIPYQNKIRYNYYRYIQQNYQIIHLHYENNNDNKIYNEIQKQQYYQNKQKQQLLISFKIKLSQDLFNNNQFKSALKQNQNQKANFIIQKTIESIQKQNQSGKDGKKWSIDQMKNSLNDLLNMVQKSIKRGVTAPANKQISRDLLALQPPSASIGGGLGKCLVDIDKYQFTNDFLKDLSKNIMIGGSIAFMLQQVPILNYFIITGGLSYTVYVTYKDEIASSVKKMKQVGKTSVMVVGAVGTTVTGMIVGEILIPIPIVGALVGGVIGGYFGEKGSRSFKSILSNKQLISLISYLKGSVIENKCWKYSEEMLGKLGVSKKYFESTISTNSQTHDIYVTTLCFCVVAYYQAIKHAQNTQKKVDEKIKKQKQQKSQNKQKIDKMQMMKNIKQQKEEQFQKNQFNLVLIIDYLTLKSINLSEELTKLQPTVLHIIA